LKAHAKSAKQSAFMRKTGYTKNGAATSATTITPKATTLVAGTGVAAGTATAAVGAPVVAVTSSRGAPEKTGGSHQQHEHHDDEDHRVGRLGIEDLGEPFDDPERESP